MLVNHADTQGEGVLGRADDHLAALHIDMARVRKVNAGQHVHQRRLAAAVLAHDAHIVAAAYLKVQVLPHRLALIAQRRIPAVQQYALLLFHQDSPSFSAAALAVIRLI